MAGLEKRKGPPDCVRLYHPFWNPPPSSYRLHPRQKVAAEIGVPNARVHDLRHTYAVLSLQNGDDIKTVQGNLGHATAAFTLDVYGHVSERMEEDSANRMQQYIENL